MTHRARFTLILGSLLLISLQARGQSDVFRSSQHDYRVISVAEGLQNPWGIAFLPGGDILVTERPGRLRIVRDGHLLEQPVAGVPAVFAEGQGGLLDVVPHPNFSSNRLVYLSYSKPLVGETGATTAIIRGRLENDLLTNIEELFVSDTRGNGHYGSRIAFDGNGYMFVTVGDRMAPPTGDLESHPAQDVTNHHGTILRLHDDGRVPADNPFVNQAGARSEIWSYGHRNPQGLAIHPETGDVWANEHGPQGGDELNLIQPGKNYGWPVVGYGVNYRSGAAIHAGTHREGMESPVHIWVPSIGISGMMIYSGDKFPQWRGSIFSGGLSGEQIARLEMDGREVVLEETLFHARGRIRDVRQGPDGFIYVAIDARQDPSALVRLEPASR
jgi:glucose/arabinose dehydrogenase